MKNEGDGRGDKGRNYVVSNYPPPPYTIHPPHWIATILEESVKQHSLLHDIICSSPISGSRWAAYFPGLLDQTLRSELVGGRIS